MDDTENTEKPNEATAQPSQCCELLSAALKAICLTRDYVGPDVLPAIDGWEWYEAAKKIAVAIPDDEWVTQFATRLDKCPVCDSDTGIKFPREDTAYCEDCGWPHEDFAEL
jgi:hypothetical protein